MWVAAGMDKPSCSRFGRGIKVSKRFRFCRRDEFGTRSQRGGHEWVKKTPLGLELSLKTELRVIMEFYKIGGIGEWDEYK
nr:unnamed protein product [Digitaria exilis]